MYVHICIDTMTASLYVHTALVQIDGQTAQGSTALMLACKRGHTDVVRVLLAAGAEINIKDT